jgi:GNAT superfamily N-acetyltransferase
MWHESEDVEQFLAAAGDLLFNEPGVHTITLTVCENVRSRPDGTRFAWWQEGSGDVTGCVSQTGVLPVVLAVVPERSMGALVELWRIDGVNGPTPLAVQVAALAARTSGRTARLKTAERLFRLERLTPPRVPGAPRVADDGDAALIVAWFEAFIAEADVIPQDVEKAVRDRLSYQGFVLWEDGGPVALAGHTRKAFQGTRIGPVYTPPEHRNRGYGGAVTAAASQQALDRGAWEVVLFTDLTNPTSNALYPRLGYEPVTDRAVFLLSSDPSA